MAIRVRLLLLVLVCAASQAQVVPYPINTAKSYTSTYFVNNATSSVPYATLGPLPTNATVSTFIESGGGSLVNSGVDTCPGSNDGSGYFYASVLNVENGSDLIYCGGAAQPLFEFEMNDNTANDAGGFDLQNYNGAGPMLGVDTAASTTCNITNNTQVVPAISSACEFITTNSQGGGDLPFVIALGTGHVAAAYWASNASWGAIGATTPTKWYSTTSTGTSNAAVTIGDTNAGSTTLITGPAGGISLGNVTTGSNADFLCLSSGGVILLQTSACTISSARFKSDIRPFKNDALGEIAHLSVDTFRLKDRNEDPNARSEQIGLIAEDIARIEPRCAIYERDMKTPKSYRQECVIAMLVRAVQEQQVEIKRLRH